MYFFVLLRVFASCVILDGLFIAKRGEIPIVAPWTTSALRFLRENPTTILWIFGLLGCWPTRCWRARRLSTTSVGRKPWRVSWMYFWDNIVWLFISWWDDRGCSDFHKKGSKKEPRATSVNRDSATRQVRGKAQAIFLIRYRFYSPFLNISIIGINIITLIWFAVIFKIIKIFLEIKVIILTF